METSPPPLKHRGREVQRCDSLLHFETEIYIYFFFPSEPIGSLKLRFNQKYLPLIDIHAAFKDSVSECHPGDVNLHLSNGSKSLQRLQNL